ncbi:hypothetical protein BH18ACT7_BH18ACT7_09600 [soil metagenome]
MRVAIVAGPDPARAFPAVALSRGMVANGDRVVLLTGSRWLPRLDQLEVPAEELPGLTGDPGSTQELVYRSPDGAAAMTPALVARLEALRPDLVVADVKTPAGGFAAELLDLPWAQLHPHPLMFSGQAAQLGRNRRAAGSRDRQRSRPTMHRRSQRVLSEARRAIGLPPEGSSPLLHLVATLPALEPSRPDWPNNASVVGPLTWDPAEHDLREPEGSEPLAVVCPSTAATDKAGLLEAALAGLRGLRVAGVVLDPWTKTVPQWATVGVGRIEPLLAHASVIVTGGGHGVLVRALMAGVPLVLVPGDRDQLALARRAEALGAAVLLRRVSPRGIRRAVDKVLGDREYAANARQIARAVATADQVVLCHQALVGRPTS